MKISDRKEFASKAPPLTCPPKTTVYDAVQDMAEKNYGSIIVVNPDNTIAGMMTERDIFKRLIAEGRDPKATLVSDIMTTDVRTARADDELLDWLRIMSNERFRRLPVVDADNKLTAVMSQGDFVSYTWPQLLGQLGTMARATASGSISTTAILIGAAAYSLILIIAVALLV